MDSSVIITIVGSLLSIILGANAFLFKQMVSGLTKVEIGLAVLVTKHDDSKDDILKIENEFVMLQRRVAKLETRVIKLEANIIRE